MHEKSIAVDNEDRDTSAMISDTTVSCTVCRERDRLARHELRADIDGRIVELWQCLTCHAILNMTDLKRVLAGDDDRSLQAMSSDDFYAVTSEFLQDIDSKISENKMIDFLLQQVPDLNKGVLIDFGAGRGITAASAAQSFDSVYAVELSLNVLAEVHRHMPLRHKISLRDNLPSVPRGYDAVASMHVLEHLPNMRDLLEELAQGLNPGGVIFFQVPMLRGDYIVSVHYTFFNEVCAKFLAKDLGMEFIGVWYDTNLDFLTCIIRKPLFGLATLGPASDTWVDLRHTLTTPTDFEEVIFDGTVLNEADTPVSLRIALLSQTGGVVEKWFNFAPGASVIKAEIVDFQALRGIGDVSAISEVYFGGNVGNFKVFANIAIRGPNVQIAGLFD